MKSKVVVESVAMMMTSFGLVAALAWNEAIKALITEVVPKKGQGVVSLFIYAILITIVVVMVSKHLIDIQQKFADEEDAKKR